MNQIASTVVTAAVMGLSTQGFADRFNSVLDDFRPSIVAAETVSGTISSVADQASSFVLRTDHSADLIVTFNDETKWTLNGAESTREEALAVGRSAKVTHESGTASRVAVTSAIDPSN